MKRMIIFSILVVFTILTGGCVFLAERPVPAIGPPPEISNSSFVSSGGTAIAIAFKADEISTASPEAKELFIKGLTYSTQYARYDESLEFFDDALAIDRIFSEAWVAKGIALHNMKRYDEAVRNYDRSLAINPDDAGTWSVKAITLRDWGKPEEAAECNRRAAELDPRYGMGTESGSKNQNKTIVATTNECGENKTGLEIYDPDSGARYMISQDQAGYGPLFDNMTPVLLSIAKQMKCSRSYAEFQRLKTNYRYVALNQADAVSGRYCYNSATCRDIPADQFIVLLNKKTGDIPETACLESGLIFAYNDGADAGIWSLGEENYSRFDNLTRNVQDIIDSGKIGTECRINPEAAVIRSPPSAIPALTQPVPPVVPLPGSTQDPGPKCNTQVADSRIPFPVNVSYTIRDPILGIRYTLNESESGRTIVLGKGELVEINLRSIPGLAYHWVIPASGCGLELANSGTYHDGGDFLSTGHYRARYRAVSPGTSVLNGKFVLPPDDIVNGAPRFNLTVIVK